MNNQVSKYLSGKKPVYFETITFDDTAAVGFNIPAPLNANADLKPYYAIAVLETGEGADAVKAAHFREDPLSISSPPTAASGMPLGNGWQYECQGYDQLQQFRIIGVGVGITHKLQVTYYKKGDQ